MKIETIRHSLAHIMALVVQELFPSAKFGIGPAIENGFYYDFDLSNNISPTDLPKIEKRMKQLIKQNLKFEKKIISNVEAKKIFKDQSYKLELIDELSFISPLRSARAIKEKSKVKSQKSKTQALAKRGRGNEVSSPLQTKSQKLSIYQIDNFVDLCSGPHVKSFKNIQPDSFKLTRIAGAYWRGNEKNKMLTRIYGIAFETKKELTDYIIRQKEAKKRDHRILGKKFGLYTIRPEVGAGLVLWKPKGAMILNLLKNWFEKEQLKKGYLPVITPHIGKKDLWITSGHWNFYNDSMYPPLELGQTLEDYQDNRKAKESETYLLKPMNCPFHIMIYNDDLHSYKDLPLKYYEFGTVYRYEQTGELGGLTRVRGMTQDDAHIICTKEQLKKEMEKVIDFAFYVLRDTFGFEMEIKASFRDKGSKKQMGSDADWNLAEKTILEILKKKKIKYELNLGEAAFYGPKIDIKVKDAIGKAHQLSTVQFDFNLSEKFNMKFTNKKGNDQRPFVIHRALFGTLERFMGVLIEHYAAAFPLWFAPEQIWIIPISDKHKEYAQKIINKLNEQDFRCKLKDENETLGKKIREGEIQKIPYLLIIGDKEIKEKTISIRQRDRGDLGAIKLEKFIEIIKKEIKNKK